jgi:hypothetical protein
MTPVILQRELAMSQRPGFERWFEKLIRNKMGGAALSTAGISIGIMVVAFGIALPVPFDKYVMSIGFFQVAASIVLFVGFALSYVIRSISKL